MANIRVLRTYRFVDKDPVIDQMRTVLSDEGLIERLGIAATLSSLSPSTLRNWFHGDTRRPQHASIMAVMTSVGYENKWVRSRRIDLESEVKAAKAWNAKNRSPKKKNRK